jgi:hypothetical protein
MAIIVGTDTYISLADAQTYLSGHYISTDSKMSAWNALNDADQEILLKKATLIIDRQPLVGYKATETQALAFPRTIYSEVPNELYNSPIFYSDHWYTQTAVPNEVKYAQCEIAIEMVTGTSNRASLQRQGVKSFTLGNLSETYSGAQNSLVSYEAKQLLAPYAGGGFRIA